MLTFEFLSILSAGFLLGLKHSLEPDHLAAISTIVSRGGPWRRAVMAGLTWGTGHTLTLFLVTLVTLGLKVTVPAAFSRLMEMAVGVMLAALGVMIIKRFFAHGLHRHDSNRPGGMPHSNHDTQRLTHHRTPFLVGLLHGLAGSAGLLVLLVAGMRSLTQGLLFSLTFGVGSMLGMALAGLALSLPLTLASERGWLKPILTLGPAVISIALGLYMVHVNWRVT